MNHARTITAATGLAALLAIGLPLTASAAECVPSAGQEYIAPTYAVQHEYQLTTPGTDAIGEEYIPTTIPATIPNPGYVGPTTRTVERDAERATEHQYTKQVRGYYQQQTGWLGWVNTGQTFDWELWGGSTQWSEQQVAVLQSGPHSAVFGEDRKKRKVSTHYRYVPTGDTRPGRITKPAWTETIPVPGNGQPETIPNPDYTGPLVPNPDYIPGTNPTTTLEWHDAGWKAPSDAYTPTGNTRTGEGITEMTDPGQEYIAPVVCEDETPVDPTDPVDPADPTDPGTDTPTVPSPVDIPAPVNTTTPAVVVTFTQPATPAPVAKVTAAAPAELATTGIDPLAAIGIAGGVIALGTAGVVTAARRRARA